MLPGKNGGGNKNSDLLSVHNRFESGAESNFGLTETNVAAKKPIHGPCHFHIVLDLLNAAELVVRFFVRKTLLKIPLPIVVFGKSIAFGAHSLGIKRNKFLRHIFNRGFNPASGLLPISGIEFVELNGFIVPWADVF